MILAGGRGHRLGGCDKPLMLIGGVTILDRQRAMLARLGVVPVLVAPADTRLTSATDLAIAHDDIEAGALGGLYTALRAAPADPVVVLAGDMPFVSAALVAALLRALEGLDVAAVSPEELAAQGADWTGLLNVNTPEDVRRAEHHAASHAAPAS